MADIPTKPINRLEQFYNAIATGDASQLPTPITREEAYLAFIAKNGGGGGGGGGTTNYNSLTNKPRVEDNELTGNKTAAQLGLQRLLLWDATPTEGSSKPVRSGGIYTAMANKVDKEAGKGLSTNDYTSDEKTKLAGIAAGAEMNIIGGITLNGEPLVPVNKIIALNVITKAVNDLQNYYLKTETYNKSEVDALINNISSLTLDIVEELPTTDISTTTIYLVPVSGATNVYMQHAYINNAWAQLGTTQVDLTNYYTKAQVDALLAAKQDVLTFDATPTASSTNPVESGGVYSALASKQDALTFDNAPTEDSNNPVKSGGVYDALAGKQDTLTFDTEPTAGSTNPVTSGGVAAALQNVDVPVATEERAGKVKPDGTTVTIDEDGTIHAAAGVEFDERDFVENDGTVALADSQRIFTGTQAEWDALSTTVKKTYGQVNITDDESDPSVVVDAVTNGDMHAVTSNAVATELEKVKIVHNTFSGNTDQSGNVYVKAYNNDYIPVFASVNTPGYTCYPFYWVSGSAFYVHVTTANGGAAPSNLAVTGDVYYIKWDNIR